MTNINDVPETTVDTNVSKEKVNYAGLLFSGMPNQDIKLYGEKFDISLDTPEKTFEQLKAVGLDISEEEFLDRYENEVKPAYANYKKLQYASARAPHIAGLPSVNQGYKRPIYEAQDFGPAKDSPFAPIGFGNTDFKTRTEEQVAFNAPYFMTKDKVKQDMSAIDTVKGYLAPEMNPETGEWYLQEYDKNDRVSHKVVNIWNKPTPMETGIASSFLRSGWNYLASGLGTVGHIGEMATFGKFDSLRNLQNFSSSLKLQAEADHEEGINAYKIFDVGFQMTELVGLTLLTGGAGASFMLTKKLGTEGAKKAIKELGYRKAVEVHLKESGLRALDAAVLNLPLGWSSLRAASGFKEEARGYGVNESDANAMAFMVAATTFAVERGIGPNMFKDFWNKEGKQILVDDILKQAGLNKAAMQSVSKGFDKKNLFKSAAEMAPKFYERAMQFSKKVATGKLPSMMDDYVLGRSLQAAWEEGREELVQTGIENTMKAMYDAVAPDLHNMLDRQLSNPLMPYQGLFGKDMSDFFEGMDEAFILGAIGGGAMGALIPKTKTSEQVDSFMKHIIRGDYEKVKNAIDLHKKEGAFGEKYINAEDGSVITEGMDAVSMNDFNAGILSEHLETARALYEQSGIKNIFEMAKNTDVPFIDNLLNEAESTSLLAMRRMFISKRLENEIKIFEQQLQTPGITEEEIAGVQTQINALKQELDVNINGNETTKPLAYYFDEKTGKSEHVTQAYNFLKAVNTTNQFFNGNDVSNIVSHEFLRKIQEEQPIVYQKLKEAHEQKLQVLNQNKQNLIQKIDGFQNATASDMVTPNIRNKYVELVNEVLSSGISPQTDEDFRNAVKPLQDFREKAMQQLMADIDALNQRVTVADEYEQFEPTDIVERLNDERLQLNANQDESSLNRIAELENDYKAANALMSEYKTYNESALTNIDAAGNEVFNVEDKMPLWDENMAQIGSYLNVLNPDGSLYNFQEILQSLNESILANEQLDVVRSIRAALEDRQKAAKQSFHVYGNYTQQEKAQFLENYLPINANNYGLVIAETQKIIDGFDSLIARSNALRNSLNEKNAKTRNSWAIYHYEVYSTIAKKISDLGIGSVTLMNNANEAYQEYAKSVNETEEIKSQKLKALEAALAKFEQDLNLKELVQTNKSLMGEIVKALDVEFSLNTQNNNYHQNPDIYSEVSLESIYDDMNFLRNTSSTRAAFQGRKNVIVSTILNNLVKINPLEFSKFMQQYLSSITMTSVKTEDGTVVSFPEDKVLSYEQFIFAKSVLAHAIDSNDYFINEVSTRKTNSLNNAILAGGFAGTGKTELIVDFITKAAEHFGLGKVGLSATKQNIVVKASNIVGNRATVLSAKMQDLKAEELSQYDILIFDEGASINMQDYLRLKEELKKVEKKQSVIFIGDEYQAIPKPLLGENATGITPLANQTMKITPLTHLFRVQYVPNQKLMNEVIKKIIGKNGVYEAIEDIDVVYSPDRTAGVQYYNTVDEVTKQFLLLPDEELPHAMLIVKSKEDVDALYNNPAYQILDKHKKRIYTIDEVSTLEQIDFMNSAQGLSASSVFLAIPKQKPSSVYHRDLYTAITRATSYIALPGQPAKSKPAPSIPTYGVNPFELNQNKEFLTDYINNYSLAVGAISQEDIAAKNQTISEPETNETKKENTSNLSKPANQMHSYNATELIKNMKDRHATIALSENQDYYTIKQNGKFIPLKRTSFFLYGDKVVTETPDMILGTAISSVSEVYFTEIKNYSTIDGDKLNTIAKKLHRDSRLSDFISEVEFGKLSKQAIEQVFSKIDRTKEVLEIIPELANGIVLADIGLSSNKISSHYFGAAGKKDITIVYKDGDYDIVDIKTSTNLNEIGNYENQTQVYGFYDKMVFGKSPRKLHIARVRKSKTVQGDKITFLNDDTVSDDKTLEFEYSDSKAKKVLGIDTSISEILNDAQAVASDVELDAEVAIIDQNPNAINTDYNGIIKVDQNNVVIQDQDFKSETVAIAESLPEESGAFRIPAGTFIQSNYDNTFDGSKENTLHEIVRLAVLENLEYNTNAQIEVVLYDKESFVKDFYADNKESLPEEILLLKVNSETVLDALSTVDLGGFKKPETIAEVEKKMFNYIGFLYNTTDTNNKNQKNISYIKGQLKAGNEVFLEKEQIFGASVIYDKNTDARHHASEKLGTNFTGSKPDRLAIQSKVVRYVSGKNTRDIKWVSNVSMINSKHSSVPVVLYRPKMDEIVSSGGKTGRDYTEDYFKKLFEHSGKVENKSEIQFLHQQFIEWLNTVKAQIIDINEFRKNYQRHIESKIIDGKQRGVSKIDTAEALSLYVRKDLVYTGSDESLNKVLNKLFHFEVSNYSSLNKQSNKYDEKVWTDLFWAFQPEGKTERKVINSNNIKSFSQDGKAKPNVNNIISGPELKQFYHSLFGEINEKGILKKGLLHNLKRVQENKKSDKSLYDLQEVFVKNVPSNKIKEEGNAGRSFLSVPVEPMFDKFWKTGALAIQSPQLVLKGTRNAISNNNLSGQNNITSASDLLDGLAMQKVDSLVMMDDAKNVGHVIEKIFGSDYAEFVREHGIVNGLKRNNIDLWGLYTNGKILLDVQNGQFNKNAEAHEAAHRILAEFLTSHEEQLVLNEAKKQIAQSGNMNVDGISNRDAHEYIADKLMTGELTPDNWFDKLMLWLKNILYKLNFYAPDIELINYRMWSGTYANMSPVRNFEGEYTMGKELLEESDNDEVAFEYLSKSQMFDSFGRNDSKYKNTGHIIFEETKNSLLKIMSLFSPTNLQLPFYYAIDNNKKTIFVHEHRDLSEKQIAAQIWQEIVLENTKGKNEYQKVGYNALNQNIVLMRSFMKVLFPKINMKDFDYLEHLPTVDLLEEESKYYQDNTNQNAVLLSEEFDQDIIAELELDPTEKKRDATITQMHHAHGENNIKTEDTLSQDVKRILKTIYRIDSDPNAPKSFVDFPLINQMLINIGKDIRTNLIEFKKINPDKLFDVFAKEVMKMSKLNEYNIGERKKSVDGLVNFINKFQAGYNEVENSLQNLKGNKFFSVKNKLRAADSWKQAFLAHYLSQTVFPLSYGVLDQNNNYTETKVPFSTINAEASSLQKSMRQYQYRIYEGNISLSSEFYSAMANYSVAKENIAGEDRLVIKHKDKLIMTYDGKWRSIEKYQKNDAIIRNNLVDIATKMFSDIGLKISSLTVKSYITNSDFLQGEVGKKQKITQERLFSLLGDLFVSAYNNYAIKENENLSKISLEENQQNLDSVKKFNEAETQEINSLVNEKNQLLELQPESIDEQNKLLSRIQELDTALEKIKDKKTLAIRRAEAKTSSLISRFNNQSNYQSFAPSLLDDIKKRNPNHQNESIIKQIAPNELAEANEESYGSQNKGADVLWLYGAIKELVTAQVAGKGSTSSQNGYNHKGQQVHEATLGTLADSIFNIPGVNSDENYDNEEHFHLWREKDRMLLYPGMTLNQAKKYTHDEKGVSYNLLENDMKIIERTKLTGYRKGYFHKDVDSFNDNEIYFAHLNEFISSIKSKELVDHLNLFGSYKPGAPFLTKYKVVFNNPMFVYNRDNKNFRFAIEEAGKLYKQKFKQEVVLSKKSLNDYVSAFQKLGLVDKLNFNKLWNSPALENEIMQFQFQMMQNNNLTFENVLQIVKDSGLTEHRDYSIGVSPQGNPYVNIGNLAKMNHAIFNRENALTIAPELFGKGNELSSYDLGQALKQISLPLYVDLNKHLLDIGHSIDKYAFSVGFQDSDKKNAVKNFFDENAIANIKNESFRNKMFELLNSDDDVEARRVKQFVTDGSMLFSKDLKGNTEVVPNEIYFGHMVLSNLFMHETNLYEHGHWSLNPNMQSHFKRSVDSKAPGFIVPVLPGKGVNKTFKVVTLQDPELTKLANQLETSLKDFDGVSAMTPIGKLKFFYSIGGNYGFIKNGVVKTHYSYYDQILHNGKNLKMTSLIPSDTMFENSEILQRMHYLSLPDVAKKEWDEINKVEAPFSKKAIMLYDFMANYEETDEATGETILKKGALLDMVVDVINNPSNTKKGLTKVMPFEALYDETSNYEQLMTYVEDFATEGMKVQFDAVKDVENQMVSMLKQFLNLTSLNESDSVVADRIAQDIQTSIANNVVFELNKIQERIDKYVEKEGLTEQDAIKQYMRNIAVSAVSNIDSADVNYLKHLGDENITAELSLIRPTIIQAFSSSVIANTIQKRVNGFLINQSTSGWITFKEANGSQLGLSDIKDLQAAGLNVDINSPSVQLQHFVNDGKTITKGNAALPFIDYRLFGFRKNVKIYELVGIKSTDLNPESKSEKAEYIDIRNLSMKQVDKLREMTLSIISRGIESNYWGEGKVSFAHVIKNKVYYEAKKQNLTDAKNAAEFIIRPDDAQVFSLYNTMFDRYYAAIMDLTSHRATRVPSGELSSSMLLNTALIINDGNNTGFISPMENLRTGGDNDGDQLTVSKIHYNSDWTKPTEGKNYFSNELHQSVDKYISLPEVSSRIMSTINFDKYEAKAEKLERFDISNNYTLLGNMIMQKVSNDGDSAIGKGALAVKVYTILSYLEKKYGKRIGNLSINADTGNVIIDEYVDENGNNVTVTESKMNEINHTLQLFLDNVKLQLAPLFGYSFDTANVVLSMIVDGKGFETISDFLSDNEIQYFFKYNERSILNKESQQNQLDSLIDYIYSENIMPKSGKKYADMNPDEAYEQVKALNEKDVTKEIVTEARKNRKALLARLSRISKKIEYAQQLGEGSNVDLTNSQMLISKQELEVQIDNLNEIINNAGNEAIKYDRFEKLLRLRKYMYVAENLTRASTMFSIDQFSVNSEAGLFKKKEDLEFILGAYVSDVVNDVNSTYDYSKRNPYKFFQDEAKMDQEKRDNIKKKSDRWLKKEEYLRQQIDMKFAVKNHESTFAFLQAINTIYETTENGFDIMKEPFVGFGSKENNGSVINKYLREGGYDKVGSASKYLKLTKGLNSHIFSIYFDSNPDFQLNETGRSKSLLLRFTDMLSSPEVFDKIVNYGQPEEIASSPSLVKMTVAGNNNRTVLKSVMMNFFKAFNAGEFASNIVDENGNKFDKAVLQDNIAFVTSIMQINDGHRDSYLTVPDFMKMSAERKAKVLMAYNKLSNLYFKSDTSNELVPVGSYMKNMIALMQFMNTGMNVKNDAFLSIIDSNWFKSYSNWYESFMANFFKNPDGALKSYNPDIDSYVDIKYNKTLNDVIGFINSSDPYMFRSKYQFGQLVKTVEGESVFQFNVNPENAPKYLSDVFEVNGMKYRAGIKLIEGLDVVKYKKNVNTLQRNALPSQIANPQSLEQVYVDGKYVTPKKYDSINNQDFFNLLSGNQVAISFNNTPNYREGDIVYILGHKSLVLKAADNVVTFVLANKKYHEGYTVSNPRTFMYKGSNEAVFSYLSNKKIDYVKVKIQDGKTYKSVPVIKIDNEFFIYDSPLKHHWRNTVDKGHHVLIHLNPDTLAAVYGMSNGTINYFTAINQAQVNNLKNNTSEQLDNNFQEQLQRTSTSINNKIGKYKNAQDLLDNFFVLTKDRGLLNIANAMSKRADLSNIPIVINETFGDSTGFSSAYYDGQKIVLNSKYIAYQYFSDLDYSIPRILLHELTHAITAHDVMAYMNNRNAISKSLASEYDNLYELYANSSAYENSTFVEFVADYISDVSYRNVINHEVGNTHKFTLQNIFTETDAFIDAFIQQSVNEYSNDKMVSFYKELNGDVLYDRNSPFPNVNSVVNPGAKTFSTLTDIMNDAKTRIGSKIHNVDELANSIFFNLKNKPHDKRYAVLKQKRYDFSVYKTDADLKKAVDAYVNDILESNRTMPQRLMNVFNTGFNNPAIFREQIGRLDQQKEAMVMFNLREEIFEYEEGDRIASLNSKTLNAELGIKFDLPGSENVLISSHAHDMKTDGKYQVNLFDITSEDISDYKDSKNIFDSLPKNSIFKNNNNGIRKFMLAVQAMRLKQLNPKLQINKIGIINAKDYKIDLPLYLYMKDVMPELIQLSKDKQFMGSITGAMKEVFSNEALFDPDLYNMDYAYFLKHFYESNKGLMSNDKRYYEYSGMVKLLADFVSNSSISNVENLSERVWFRMQYLKSFYEDNQGPLKLDSDKEYLYLSNLYKELTKTNVKGYNSTRDSGKIKAFFINAPQNFQIDEIQDYQTKLTQTMFSIKEQFRTLQIERQQMIKEQVYPFYQANNGGRAMMDKLVVNPSAMFEHLFQKHTAIDEKTGQSVEINTGIMHIDENNAWTKKALSEGKIDKSQLDFNKKIFNQFIELYRDLWVHKNYSKKFDEKTREQRLKDLKAEFNDTILPDIKNSGLLPIMPKEAYELFLTGNIEQAKNRWVNQMTDPGYQFEEFSKEHNALNYSLSLINQVANENSYSDSNNISTMYGNKHRMKKLGLYINDNGELYVNRSVNNTVSSDLQTMMDAFSMAAIRTIQLDTNVVPMYNSIISILKNKQKLDKYDKNSQQINIEALERLHSMLVLGKTEKIDTDILGVNADAVVNGVTSSMQFGWIAWSVPSGISQGLQMIYQMNTNAMVNSVLDTRFFGMKDLYQAGALAIKDFDKWMALNDFYQISEFDERALMNSPIFNKRYSLFSSFSMQIFNWYPDFFARMTGFVAQMVKDGSYDAHVMENGVLVYKPELDKRKGDMKYWNAYKKTIKENNIKTGWQKNIDGDIERAYDFMEVNSVKDYIAQYMTGGYESEYSAVGHQRWWMRMFLSMKKFMTRRVENLYTTKFQKTALGQYKMISEMQDDGTVKENLIWAKEAFEGKLNSMFSAVSILKDMQREGVLFGPQSLKMFNERLTDIQKRNIAKLTFDLGLFAMLSYLLLEVLDDDDDEKESIMSTKLGRAVWYSVKDLALEYSPRYLIEMTSNPVIMAKYLSNYVEAAYGVMSLDYDKFVGSAGKNVFGSNSYKMFSEILTAKD